MNPIVQFNARIPDALRCKVRQDRARTNEGIDTIVTAILQYFFREVPLARRREMYAAVRPAPKSLRTANGKSGRNGSSEAAGDGAVGEARALPAAEHEISQRGGKDAGQIPAATVV